MIIGTSKSGGREMGENHHHHNRLDEKRYLGYFRHLWGESSGYGGGGGGR